MKVLESTNQPQIPVEANRDYEVAADPFQIQIANYQPGPILFNGKNLRDSIEQINQIYETLQYTGEDQEEIKKMKKELAKLRKVDKSIKSKVSQIKEEYMKSFNAFEVEVNETRSLLDKSISNLAKQSTEFEEKRKKEKRKEIEAFFKETDLPIRLDQIFEERWLNVSTTMASIKKTIIASKEQCEKDLESLASCEKYYKEVKEEYLKTLDLSAALKKNELLLEQEQLIVKRETERKQKQRELKEESETKQVGFGFDPLSETEQIGFGFDQAFTETHRQPSASFEDPVWHENQRTEDGFEPVPPDFSFENLTDEVPQSLGNDTSEPVLSNESSVLSVQDERMEVSFKLGIRVDQVPIFLKFLEDNGITFTRL